MNLKPTNIAAVRKGLFALALAAGACVAQAGGAFALKPGVALPDNPRPSEKYAAEEWCTWSSQVTGWKCAVVPEKDASVVLKRDDALGEDAFRLKAEQGRLVISGGRRGILYGVYEALERFAGVGWFSANTTVVPKAPAIKVADDLDVTERPAFELRQPLFYELSKDPDLSARLKVNAPQIKERHGGCSHTFDSVLGNCHTFESLVPPKKYFKDHPEYFSEINGERTGHNSQLCLTNPDVLKIAIAKVLERMRANPTARYFGVSANDNMRYCRCAKCAAVDAEEGSHAGTLLRFVNAVAAATEKEFPDKVIETLAYQHTRKPPKKTRALPNVMPCLCSIECDFSTPLATSPNANNKAFMEDLRGWAAQTDQLYIWDYVVNFTKTLSAFPNLRVLQPNMKTFRDNKVKSMFAQGPNRYYHEDLAELRAYLLAKLMWNPEQPVEPLVAKFCDAYYGKGASAVRKYLRELHELPRDPLWQPLSIYESSTSFRIPDDFIERAAKLWDAAEAATKDDPRTSFNVRMGRLAIDTTRLLRHRDAERRWSEYQTLAKKTVAAMREGHVNLDDKPYSYGETFAEWEKLSKSTYAQMNADLTIEMPQGIRKAFSLDRFFFTPGERYTLQVRAHGGGFSAHPGVWDSNADIGGGCTVAAKDVPAEGKWFDVHTWTLFPGELMFPILGPDAVLDAIRLVPAKGEGLK